ncbi:YciI family protein [Glaciihabitans sp. dw_435]|uniref:YciI family protein n=1 Tax=Glaciihabitans sp. dw_435 TaxID=2720081 RepID=UPI001BD6330A|nr:YciI family protein [Glaciihabitans sp. dw_435]
MTKYLISFPGEALTFTGEELATVSDDSHAVIQQLKDAGVYVFGGGINEDVAPVLVTADGSVSADTYPGSRLTGGFLVLELPDRSAAEEWAAKVATACRCSQEIREFGFDPES